MPAERVTEVKRRGKVTTERKLFPGYIYAELDLQSGSYRHDSRVDAVTGFLGSTPERPDPNHREEAERIIKIAAAESAEDQRAVLRSNSIQCW